MTRELLECEVREQYTHHVNDGVEEVYCVRRRWVAESGASKRRAHRV